MQNLTDKQNKTLNTIVRLEQENGKMPTLQEIAESMGLTRASSVQRYVQALIELGYLVKDSIKSKSVKIASSLNSLVKIPLVGRISCGTPLLATENIEAYIPFPDLKLRGETSGYFFLRASGDSMNNTNINNKQVDDGDFVLIKKQNTANKNDRIVALLGDDATLKKLDFEDGLPVLQPESTNPMNKKLIIIDDLLIQGVAVDVIKKGQNYV